MKPFLQVLTDAEYFDKLTDISAWMNTEGGNNEIQDKIISAFNLITFLDINKPTDLRKIKLFIFIIPIESLWNEWRNIVIASHRPLFNWSSLSTMVKTIESIHDMNYQKGFKTRCNRNEKLMQAKFNEKLMLLGEELNIACEHWAWISVYNDECNDPKFIAAEMKDNHAQFNRLELDSWRLSYAAIANMVYSLNGHTLLERILAMCNNGCITGYADSIMLQNDIEHLTTISNTTSQLFFDSGLYEACQTVNSRLFKPNEQFVGIDVYKMGQLIDNLQRITRCLYHGWNGDCLFYPVGIPSLSSYFHTLHLEWFNRYKTL